MKNKIEKEFTNELGNKIFIKIKKLDKDISVSLEGPKSISENIITLKEAEELSKSLVEFLK